MKKDERIINYYDFSVKTSARSFPVANNVSVKEFFDLMERIPLSNRSKSVRHGREFYYISDWRKQGSYLLILVNKSDKGLSDPVFSVPQENKRRTANKSSKEGQDFSAHIVIKLPKNKLDPGLVAVERCTGLSVYHISRLFNQVLRDCKKTFPQLFLQNHPDGSVGKDGKPKTLSVLHHCDFEAHISDKLIDDLERGTIQGLELVTEKSKKKPFDSKSYLEEKCETLSIKVNDDGSWAQKFKNLKGVAFNNSKKYEKARIRFKYESGVSGQVELESETGVADGYVKKSKITSQAEDLKSSYNEICDDIALKMKKLI